MDCRVFQALSEEIRLRILLVLASGDANVTQLRKKLGAPQPTVSRHLKVLSDAGIVKSMRSGKQVYYRIEIPTIKQAKDFIDKLISGRREKTLVAPKQVKVGKGLRGEAKKPSSASSGDWEDKERKLGSISHSDMDDFLL